MVNRCAHKGTPLVLTKSGTVDQFMCIYHNWCFDLNGNLRSVAFEKGVRGKGGCSQWAGQDGVRLLRVHGPAEDPGNAGDAQAGERRDQEDADGYRRHRRARGRFRYAVNLPRPRPPHVMASRAFLDLKAQLIDAVHEEAVKAFVAGERELA